MSRTFSVSKFALAGICVAACAESAPGPEGIGQGALVADLYDQIPNNTLLANEHGFAATFSDAGSVDLDNAYFTPQGTNGRHCGTCHAPEAGWTLTGAIATELFRRTDGLHPLFANHLDTDTPTADMSTADARWKATTMLRQGKFVRKAAPPAPRDFDVVAVDDPFGVSTTSLLFWFRRPLPTANFRSFNVLWDSQLTTGTDLVEGLKKQARGAVLNVLQGPAAPETVTAEITTYERQLSHAQLYLDDVGRLDVGGARGGPAYAAQQPLVAGRFDLYDAWKSSPHENQRQIWRGQEVFNNVSAPSGRRCAGCHTAANNGQNVEGALFDIGASRPDFARSDMAVFTIQSRATGATIRTTDPGQAIRTGQLAHMNLFKVPNLRGLASRAPYFHNGIAENLEKVVKHYKDALGFDFTSDERDDLIAFLKAL
jgi:cytochrome c peroxidase